MFLSTLISVPIRDIYVLIMHKRFFAQTCDNNMYVYHKNGMNIW